MGEDVDRALRGRRFVVGEYTTDVGPFAEDHFLVLVSEDGEILEFPTGQRQAQEVMDAVCRTTGKEVEFELANCTSFKSRILYPESLKGEALFEFKRRKASRNPIVTMFRQLAPQSIDANLTKRVLEYLSSGPGPVRMEGR